MELSKKENILIGRFGSKDNDIKFFINYLPVNCKIVVEPFGGSFAICRRVYNDDKYIKVVNDLDTYLYKSYINPEETARIKNKYDEMTKEYNCKYDIFIKEWDKYDADKNIKSYVINTLVINGKHMSKPHKNTIDYANQINFLKKINFSNDDYLVVLDKYKTNKDAFLFLDPPYLFSNNKTYVPCENDETDTTNILIKIKEFMEDKKTKCKIMLIINKLDIIVYLFKKYIKGEYIKCYQAVKNTMKHLIICNYDI